MFLRLTGVIALVLSVSVTAGCAKDEFEGLTMFKKIRESKKLFTQAQEKTRSVTDESTEKGQKKIDEAIALNKKAIELIPSEPDYQFQYAHLLYKKGIYHDKKSLDWRHKADGKKFIKETVEWIEERPMPKKEDRNKWREKSKQHRDVASEFFNRVLRRLNIIESLRPDNPDVLQLRGLTYIVLLEMKKAREVYIKLSRDSRLTEERRRAMERMIELIDNDAVYKKQLKLNNPPGSGFEDDNP